jgi:hypothetical protein
MFEARLIQGNILKKIMHTIKDLVVSARIFTSSQNQYMHVNHTASLSLSLSLTLLMRVCVWACVLYRTKLILIALALVLPCRLVYSATVFCGLCACQIFGHLRFCKVGDLSYVQCYIVYVCIGNGFVARGACRVVYACGRLQRLRGPTQHFTWYHVEFHGKSTQMCRQ